MEKANAFYRSAMSKIQNDREQWGQDNVDNGESTLDDDEKAALLTRRLYQTVSMIRIYETNSFLYDMLLAYTCISSLSYSLLHSLNVYRCYSKIV